MHRFLGLVPTLNGGDDAVGVRGPEEGFLMRVFRGAGPFLGSHYGYSGNPPTILCWFRLPRRPPASFLFGSHGREVSGEATMVSG